MSSLQLDPHRAQRVLLAKFVGASRYVYNWGLAESKRQYELTGKRPRLGDLKKQLVALKSRGGQVELTRDCQHRRPAVMRDRQFEPVATHRLEASKRRDHASARGARLRRTPSP